MKKSSLFILAMVCSLGSVLAQRNVDYAFTVPAPDYGESTFKGASVGGDAYIAAYEALYKFDGTSTVGYSYPVRDGVQLSISNFYGGTNIDTWTLNHNRALPTLNSVIYLNLRNQDISACRPCTHFLYQFSDGLITPSPITDPVLSNVAVFQNKIYAVVKSGGTGRLISFDGTTITVVIPSLEFNDVLALFATDQFLYIADHKFNGPDDTNTEVFVKRFDGSTVIDIPSFDLPLSYVREVYQLPGETVYFHSESDITRFDGTTVTEIAETPAGRLDYVDLAVFENIAYYVTWNDTGQIVYRNNGTGGEVLTLPDGASIILTADALLVYDGELFMASRLPSGVGAIYKYDGTTFTRFTVGATSFTDPSGLYERDGKLLMNSHGAVSYEYYRGALCRIESNSYYPSTILSTGLFYVWWNTVRPGDAVVNLEFAIERKTGCGTLIPTPVGEFDFVDIRTIGPERGWCWNEIILNWTPEVICDPPYCFDQSWQASMKDSNNKVAFQKVISKPAEISIPLADAQPYTFSLDLWSTQTKSFENVLSIDEELVPLGVSSISLFMKPKEGMIIIDAQTDKNKDIPLQLTLLSEDGEALWQETFVAPLKKEFSGTVDKPGVSLRLSAIASLDKIAKSEWKVNYYPNPFTNKITVEFDPEKKAPVNFAIYSMQGEQLQYNVTESPGAYVLEIDPKNKPGLYILSVRSCDKELRKLIELRYAK